MIKTLVMLYGPDKGKNILQNNYKLAKALNQQINTYELVYVYASTMDKVRI